MINEKKEQMIRETFDQCLSGIDSLSSELPAIERKLKKAKTPDREPIRFRVPAIAAVLVILLCFGFFARGKWGMINQPDRIRSEDGYTTQPVQTALAQGTEQDAGTVTVQPEPVQTILAEGTEPAAGTVIVQPEFELNDGNHRLQAYENLGIEKAWVIIWITEEAERDDFMEKYGEYVKECKVIRR